jgi:hypothetical protein
MGLIMSRWRHPNPVHWHRLKSEIAVRAAGRCEFCRARPPSDLHHRTYIRWGDELPHDVMFVCRRCHLRIEEKDRPPIADGEPESLYRRGDDGRGLNRDWYDYLESAGAIPDDEFEPDDLDRELGIQTLCDDIDEDYEALYREFDGDLDAIEAWAWAMGKDD